MFSQNNSLVGDEHRYRVIGVQQTSLKTVAMSSYSCHIFWIIVCADLKQCCIRSLFINPLNCHLILQVNRVNLYSWWKIIIIHTWKMQYWRLAQFDTNFVIWCQAFNYSDVCRILRWPAEFRMLDCYTNWCILVSKFCLAWHTHNFPTQSNSH